ncbi:MAG: DUF1648 domain-containing protein [Clostridia bacterium]|nr:DUF1648 domain-containing protein [Clostridia bacterium]
MKNRVFTQAVLSFLVCLVPILLTLSLYDKLPDRVPIHFGMNGQPDNYASKAIAGFLFPALLGALNLFVHFSMNTDPKKRNANPVIRAIGLWTIPVMSLIFVPITLFKGLGYEIPIVTVSTALVGLLILVIGNYLPKSRQSYTVGIKLPWTLDSEENWNKTHRLSGFVWVLGGLIIIANAFIGSIYVLFAVIALIAVFPVVCSYLIYRGTLSKKEDNK